MTKNAPFLQKNHKKYQFFTIFLALFAVQLVKTRNPNTLPTRPLTSLRAHFGALFNTFTSIFPRIIHHRQNHSAKQL